MRSSLEPSGEAPRKASERVKAENVFQAHLARVLARTEDNQKALDVWFTGPSEDTSPAGKFRAYLESLQVKDKDVDLHNYSEEYLKRVLTDSGIESGVH